MSCSYTYSTPECAANIKHATYFSFENILTVLTECVNFKASGQRPDFMVLLKDLLEKKAPDCNCVKIVIMTLLAIAQESIIYLNESYF